MKGEPLPLPRSIKKPLRWAIKASRPLIGLKPEFIIIGAMKAGTSSLFAYLGRHPRVCPAPAKEIHYFDLSFDQGPAWYWAHFPTIIEAALKARRLGPGLITGEASPYYIFHPHAPRRAFETVPQAKIIAILRNPVDRAFSHYRHQVKKGRETLSFEEALNREEERLAGELELMLADEGYYSFNHQHFSYLARGLYLDQLRAWERYFPRERFLIIKSEDLFARPEAVIKEIWPFLGLPGQDIKNFKVYNQGISGHLDPFLRQRLVERFAGPNQELYEFLGRDLGWDS
ncbi:MAG: sulfotransferase domain-containing protein [Deltaproteobacteria bacterium]|nr:sulfotransferase domain-containing protein [Deltaproteobacteria bacterium]